MLSSSATTARRVRIAILLVVGACAIGSTAALAGSVRPNVIRFADEEDRLSDQKASIQELLESTVAMVKAVLPLDGVTITVIADRERSIPGYGVGGFTPDANTVNLYIDPDFPDLGGVLVERLPQLLAHELHHAKRWRGPGYGHTLFEAMISEGLADRFAVELLGGPVPPWSDAITPDEGTRLLEASRRELDAANYDHVRWFFGSSASPPRWAGYTIGYRLVMGYQARHPGATAAGLVSARAKLFRP